jgi:hypothetical protein
MVFGDDMESEDDVSSPENREKFKQWFLKTVMPALNPKHKFRVAGTPLLQVLTPSGELLIPLAEDICTRIDVGSRRIEVILPEGLQGVNASE